MNPKVINLEISTMCHPEYSRWNRNLPGKKKHYITIENNRMHTYKLIDDERVECNEGRCKVIKEEFYEDAECATSYRFEPYTNQFLPDAIKVFIREEIIPLREKRISNHRLGFDHLEFCEIRNCKEANHWQSGERGMADSRAVAVRVQWILDQRLQARSVSQEHRDEIIQKACSGYKWKHTFATLRFLDWLKCDGYPTIKYTSRSGETHESPVQVAGYSAFSGGGDGVWCPTENLEDSDWVLAWCAGTAYKIFRDGRPHEMMFRVTGKMNA